MAERDILNIDEAAELLGVSVKTFNKVLHAEDLPARKIGREWKFSRQALINWVGSGQSRRFYKEGAHEEERDEIVPAQRGSAPDGNGSVARPRARRTAGWAIEE